MATNQRGTYEVEALFLAKEKRRRTLARLPIDEKIRVLVELQKMADGIRAAVGRSGPPVWHLPECETPTSSVKATDTRRARSPSRRK